LKEFSTKFTCIHNAYHYRLAVLAQRAEISLQEEKKKKEPVTLKINLLIIN
jgi:hypothetical protein